ncbi:MAG: hypothetical protein U5L02_13205 [Rheinheimera sp.]|nr:hypothetical protein [Rheinheimera sp.]
MRQAACCLVQSLKRKSPGMVRLNPGEMTIKHLIFALDRAVQKDTGQKVDSQSDEFIQMMADALAGKVSEKLGPETKAALVAMRQYIDALSGDYLSVIQGKIDALTEQIKQDDKYTDKVKALNEIELYEKIKGNMGVYVNRSYRAFDDPKWFQKVPVEVINRAREYLRSIKRKAMTRLKPIATPK